MLSTRDIDKKTYLIKYLSNISFGGPCPGLTVKSNEVIRESKLYIDMNHNESIRKVQVEYSKDLKMLRDSLENSKDCFKREYLNIDIQRLEIRYLIGALKLTS